MMRTVKILTSILICGLVYSFYRAFAGKGGSGLYDFFDALEYSSLALFIISLIILVVNFRALRNHWPAFIFLLIGLPLTLNFVLGIIADVEYNRKPDLSVKYKLPVDREQYLFDSTNTKLAIDSYALLRNEKYGGPDILYGVIDTIIYSQKGDKIFISYINKYEPHNFDEAKYFHPNSFVADKRDSVFWQLTEPRYSMGGSYRDIKTLKKEIRKFYFNRFSFLDKDSTSENYFWKIVL